MINYKKVKTLIDIVFSLLLIIVLIPVFILLFITLFFHLKQFPLLKQKRGITLSNRVITIYKFKTFNNPDAGRQTSNDIFYKKEYRSYVSNFCRYLRKAGLDELPQLFNVIKGEMSLIGPRPFMFSDLELLKNDFPVSYVERNNINLKPGISGFWQVFGDRKKGIQNLINMDNKYCEIISFKVDILILKRTLKIMLLAKNSDAIVNGNTVEKIPEISDLKKIA